MKNMNLPNKLTLLRVLMIPIFMIFALLENGFCQFIALALFVLASLTDYLDGYTARKCNLVTDFGKFMDPIADKLLVMSAMVILVAQNRMPAWICVVMLAREFIISGFRLVAAGKGTVIAAGMTGKIKTVTQMAAIIMLFLLSNATGGGSGFFYFLSNVVLYASAILSIVSCVEYVWNNRAVIADM